MENYFGFEIRETLVEPRPKWQGRSKKPLRAKTIFRGGIYIARWEGRGHERFFGSSPEIALHSLKTLGCFNGKS